MIDHLVVQFRRLVVLLGSEVEVVRILIIAQQRWFFALVLLLLPLLLLLRNWILVALLTAGLATASS